MKISGIYRITNSVTGVSYIGSSVDIHRRWSKHRQYLRQGNHDNLYFQRAWDKYGEKIFEFAIIEFCPREGLLDLERSWLLRVSSVYNLDMSPTRPECGRKRPEFTIEHRRKLSESNLGKPKPKPEGFSQTVAESWKKRSRTASENTKKKMSIAHLGKPRPVSYIEKMTGRRWVFNPITKEHRRVIPCNIPEGWRFGICKQ